MKKSLLWLVLLALISSSITATGFAYVKDTKSVNKLAFMTKRNGQWDICVINEDGSGLVKITDSTQKKEDYLMPVWSPTGQKLIFRKNNSKEYELWIANSDGSSLLRITNNLALSPALWSPDGLKVLFVTEEKNRQELKVYNVEDCTVNSLTKSDIDSIESSYSWAPDSKRVVCVLKYDRKTDIYILGLENDQKLKVTETSGEYKHPRWSPDGRKIVFVADKFIGKSGLYLMNADGSNMEHISKEENAICIEWAPDSSAIKYTHYVTKIEDKPKDRYLYGLGVYNLIDGKEATETLNSYTKELFDASWSPDSKKLAFRINQHVFWVGVDLKKMEQVEIPYAAGKPVWSPDSSRIACAGYDNINLGRKSGVFIASIIDNTVRKLTEGLNDYYPVWTKN